jgi:hypothetical protein
MVESQPITVEVAKEFGVPSVRPGKPSSCWNVGLNRRWRTLPVRGRALIAANITPPAGDDEMPVVTPLTGNAGDH